MLVIRKAPHVADRLSRTVSSDPHNDPRPPLEQLLRRYESAGLGCMDSIALPVDGIMYLVFPYNIQVDQLAIAMIYPRTVLDNVSSTIVVNVGQIWADRLLLKKRIAKSINLVPKWYDK
jgi:hypothetical protein